MGCSTLWVNRAQNLRTGEQLELEHASKHVAAGAGWVYGGPGAWELGAEAALRREGVLPLHGEPQMGTDGEWVALATDDDLQVGRIFGNTRQHAEPAPAPWYRPAVAGGHVAWVTHEGESEDIWLLDIEARVATVLADGPGHERHVALSTTHVAWIEDDAVVLKPLDGDAVRFPADAHTARSLTLDGDVVCWEQWNGTDVDVACSDGVRIERPGHQRNPSRHGDLLLVVEDGQALLWLPPVPTEPEIRDSVEP